MVRGFDPAHDVATIIVAEDDEFVRRYFSDVLEFAGHEVLPASTGLEALDLVHRRPDASMLLTDVQMPGMDGIALAHRARQLHPDLAVIYVTGRCPRDLTHAAVPDSSILLKPIRATVLLTMVAMLLGGAEARSRGGDPAVGEAPHRAA